MRKSSIRKLAIRLVQKRSLIQKHLLYVVLHGHPVAAFVDCFSRFLVKINAQCISSHTSPPQ